MSTEELNSPGVVDSNIWWTIGFNPRPRTSGRLFSDSAFSEFNRFNPRPRTSGRPAEAKYVPAIQQFQSTPPYKRATPRGISFTRYNWFQSTPPYKRATNLFCKSNKASDCFNPRPRTSGRQILNPVFDSNSLFQSTPPYKRATYHALTYFFLS